MRVWAPCPTWFNCDRGGSGTTCNALKTEGGDWLITEGGDCLTPETN